MRTAAILLAAPLLLGLAGGADAQQARSHASTGRSCANGCLVLVNDSENSDIVGFFLYDGHSTAKHRFNVRWTENVFGTRQSGAGLAINPHKAWWMPIPRDLPCAVRIGVNFRDRTTRKVRTGPEGNVNLCRPGRNDVVFRAKEAQPGLAG